MTTKTREENLPALQNDRREMSVPDMMGAIIEKGITAESVTVMKELVQLKRDMDTDAAKIAFNRAFVALKRDCKPIAATSMIPCKPDGKGNVAIRSRFASYQDIMKAVGPLLERHGFTESFSQSVSEGKTTITVTLMHEQGYERSSEFTCRSQESPGNSGAQNDGGTATFAKRYALCNMLGIVIDYDSDARPDGDTITPEMAAGLEKRVKAVCGNDVAKVNKYLELADAGSFAEVKRAKYEVIVQLIEMKERSK